MREVAADHVACHNCGAPLHGRFCAACGQEARPLNPSLYEIGRELVHEVTDVDGRIFTSVRRLFLSPGFLTREHFAGRRAAWVSPVRLYLIFSVAYFGVVAFAGTNVRITFKGGAPQETAAELRKLGFDSEEEMRQALGRAQATWMPRVMFVLVPFFAWLVGRVRRGPDHAYPHHVLFALHAHAAWFGANALATTGQFLRSPAVTQGFAILTMLYGVAYVAIALQVAYGGTKRRAIRDTVIVLGAYGTIVIGATLAIVVPALFWHR